MRASRSCEAGPARSAFGPARRPDGSLRSSAIRSKVGEAEQSTGEAGLGNAADAKIVNGEEAAAKDAVAGKARQWWLGHGSRIEDVEGRAAAPDARHFLHRHVADTIAFAVRRVAHDSAVVDQGIPEAPLGVDGRTVGGPAARTVNLAEGALVGDGAGVEIVVVGPDLARPGVGEIEGAPIRTPARAIRNDDAVVELVQREVRIETIEGAIRTLFHRVHR